MIELWEVAMVLALLLYACIIEISSQRIRRKAEDKFYKALTGDNGNTE